MFDLNWDQFELCLEAEMHLLAAMWLNKSFFVLSFWPGDPNL